MDLVDLVRVSHVTMDLPPVVLTESGLRGSTLYESYVSGCPGPTHCKFARCGSYWVGPVIDLPTLDLVAQLVVDLIDL